MGEAFDSRGNSLGGVWGETKREVFDKLMNLHPDAHEIRIKSLEAKFAEEESRIRTEAANPPGQREMPRYRCHKVVHALKIKDVIKHAHPDPSADDAAFEASSAFQGAHLFVEESGYAPFPVSAEWYRKHNPQPGGYYVVYDDGYASWSPAKAFEDGYTRI